MTKENKPCKAQGWPFPAGSSARWHLMNHFFVKFPSRASTVWSLGVRVLLVLPLSTGNIKPKESNFYSSHMTKKPLYDIVLTWGPLRYNIIISSFHLYYVFGSKTIKDIKYILNYLFYFYAYNCLAWMYVWTLCVCLVPAKVRRGC